MNSKDCISNSVASLTQSQTSDTRIELAETDSSAFTENSNHRMFESDYLPPNINDNGVFGDNGYILINKICDTLQGALFKAVSMESMRGKPQYVAIKKTSKLLLKQRIAIENEMSLCVSENIVKEALILRYLTVHNTPIGDYIVKYVDFFESDTDYYLVMQYIDSDMSLKQFICLSRQYISNGTLSMNNYVKMVKYLLWQLFVTIQWMHISCHCAHLDLCSDNIMLQNASFIDEEGKTIINPRICVKLCDFGVSEIFCNAFSCSKNGLSIYNEGYFSPNVFHHETFDARCADNWMLGIILFECLSVGGVLYTPSTMYQSHSGYWALHHNKLREYLGAKHLLKYFNCDSFSLIHSLLNVNERRRLKGMDILKHKWFAMYFVRYKNQIKKKFGHKIDQKKMNIHHFPFYDI